MATSCKSFCPSLAFLEESSGDRLVSTSSGITFGSSINKHDCSDGDFGPKSWKLTQDTVSYILHILGKNLNEISGTLTFFLYEEPQSLHQI